MRSNLIIPLLSALSATAADVEPIEVKLGAPVIRRILLPSAYMSSGDAEIRVDVSVTQQGLPVVGKGVLLSAKTRDRSIGRERTFAVLDGTGHAELRVVVPSSLHDRISLQVCLRDSEVCSPQQTVTTRRTDLEAVFSYDKGLVTGSYGSSPVLDVEATYSLAPRLVVQAYSNPGRRPTSVTAWVSGGWSVQHSEAPLQSYSVLRGRPTTISVGCNGEFFGHVLAEGTWSPAISGNGYKAGTLLYGQPVSRQFKALAGGEFVVPTASDQGSVLGKSRGAKAGLAMSSPHGSVRVAGFITYLRVDPTSIARSSGAAVDIPAMAYWQPNFQIDLYPTGILSYSINAGVTQVTPTVRAFTWGVTATLHNLVRLR